MTRRRPEFHSYMHLSKITEKSKDLKEIKALYQRAFPANERTDFEENIEDNSASCEAYAFYDHDEFCGFFCLLNDMDITHITYFAIEESKRGHGYGSQALHLLQKMKPGRRIIADLELAEEGAPNNSQRNKRKLFYLGNGYQETGIRYRWQKEDYEILSQGGPVTGPEFEQFWVDIETA